MLMPKEGTLQWCSPEEKRMASDREPDVQLGVVSPSEWRCDSLVTPSLQERLLPARPRVGGAWQAEGNCVVPTRMEGGNRTTAGEAQRGDCKFSRSRNSRR